MIQVKAWARRGRYGLEMRGHADYNPGNDIVCAGASAIAYALAGYLDNCGEHRTKQISRKLKSGDLELCCEGDETVAAGYRMAAIGFLQMEQAHPIHVHVKISGNLF